MSGNKRLPVVSRPEDKTVLPEVLPDPRAARARAAGPRQRTVAHMHRMLATAAALGIALGCGKTTGPKAAPGDKRGCGGDKAGGGGELGGSSGDMSSSGYAVVDPMPPPAHCPGIADAIAATATREGDVVVVRFPLPSNRADYKYMTDSPAYAYDATVVSSAVKDGAIVVTLRPESGVRRFGVSVKGFCDAGPSTISADVSWEGDGGALTVLLNDY